MFKVPKSVLQRTLVLMADNRLENNTEVVSKIGSGIIDYIRETYVEDHVTDHRDVVAATYFAALFFTSIMTDSILEDAPDEIKKNLAVVNLFMGTDEDEQEQH